MTARHAASAALAVAISLASPPAPAADIATPKLCAPDVARFCAPDSAGAAARSCLRQHHVSLTLACRHALHTASAPRDTPRDTR